MRERIMNSLKPKVFNLIDRSEDTKNMRRAFALLMEKLHEKNILSTEEIEQMLEDIQKDDH